MATKPTSAASRWAAVLQRRAVAIHGRAGHKSGFTAAVLYQRDALGGDDLAAITPQFQRTQMGRQRRQIEPEGSFVAFQRLGIFDHIMQLLAAGRMHVEGRIAILAYAAAEFLQALLGHAPHELYGLEAGIALVQLELVHIALEALAVHAVIERIHTLDGQQYIEIGLQPVFRIAHDFSASRSKLLRIW
jgi:hypothetical protein